MCLFRESRPGGRMLAEVPAAESLECQPCYRKQAERGWEQDGTFVEWNKRGYVWKKLQEGGKELPGSIEEGSNAVEFIVNRR